MLKIKNLSKSFSTNKVLENIDFELEEKRSYAFVGVSGCGKTTLARIITGLEEPDNGTLIFQGKTLSSLSERTLLEKKQIQLVFQNALGSFNPRRKIVHSLNNVFQVHRKLYPLSKERETRIFTLLELLELEKELLFQYPHQVSGGQIQRFALLRALLIEPKILIADEPSSALDPLSKKKLISILQKVRQSTSISYLIITHDFSYLESLVDWVFVLDSGQIVEENTPAELLQRPQKKHTKKLIEAIPKIQRASKDSKRQEKTGKDTARIVNDN